MTTTVRLACLNVLTPSIATSGERASRMLASHSDGRAQRSAWDASRASAIQDSASKIMRSVGWPALTSIRSDVAYAVIVRRLKRSTATPEDQGGSPLIERPDLGCVLKKLVMSVISAVRTITL